MKLFTHIAWIAVVSAAAAVCSYGYEADSLIASLRLTKYVQPEFPARLRLEGIPTGMVSLVISRNEAGEPTDILILEATRPLVTWSATYAWRSSATPCK